MNYIKCALIVLTFSLILKISNAARILVFSQALSTSHQSVFRPVIEELARRGHHLVVVTMFPSNSKDPLLANITEINVYDDESLKVYDIVNTQDLVSNVFEGAIGDWLRHIELPEVRKAVFDSDKKFDLLFFDYASPINVLNAELLNIPSVGMVTYCGMPFNWRAAGSPVHPILYGDTVIENDGRMSFYQRTKNLLTYIRFELLYYIYSHKYQEIVSKFVGREMSSLASSENFVDMVFINMFPILAGNRPITPSTVLLGGMHIMPRKPLPTNMQEYLDKSENGVIYFSLGTFVLSKNLPLSKKKLLLEVFKELPYTVLWKFEDDSLQDVPKNVLISRFFPQYDIFAHPKIKLFITHGGLQSMEEAILSGIPMLTMPFFWDQYRNAKLVEKHAIGKTLKFQSITKESLKDTILSIINNGKYKENIKHLSKQITDQPMSSRDKAVWWIEYVLRHRGAKHLRPNVVDIPLYQYFMLDIVLLGTVLLATVIVTIYYGYILLINFISRFVQRRQGNKNKKLKKKLK